MVKEIPTERLWSLVLPSAISVMIAVLGIAFVYGQYGERLSMVQQTQLEEMRAERITEGRVSAHDVSIAVTNQKLDVIIAQLASMNTKLERADTDRKRQQ